ncbi:MAG: hypothetical protein IKF80_09475, partial [Erysipelotrichaceae bacterium]|nr:hypothetical protein [Erysipelotrichaceae bacterium]
MSFTLKEYITPDFDEERFKKAPDAKLVEVIDDGVAPDGCHALSIYPEYFKIDGKWYLVEESRM